MIRIRKGMLFLMLLLGLTACSQVERQTLDLVTQQPNADTRFVLTILHNNDGESQLIDVGPGLTDYGGAARFATLLDDLRWEALHGPRQVGQTGAKRGVITVSSGDNFLAGPEFDASLEHGVPFYDTIALDLMEYDAMALGNHDFDFGPDVLADFIEGFAHSQPTFVSANLRFDLEPRLGRLVDAGRIARSVVIRERGERVGIVGATTPNLRFISSPRNVEVLADVAAAIQTEVDQLTSRGIDKIVLISHLQDIEGDLALAAELEDVDVMVAGGGDELLANDGDLLVPGDTTYGPYPLFATDGRGVRVPVVTTRGSYAYVGRLRCGHATVADAGRLLRPVCADRRLRGGCLSPRLPGAGLPAGQRHFAAGRAV